MSKRKKIRTMKASLLIIGLMLCGVIFSSVTILLVIGMLPTIVAAIVDTSRGRLKTLTVGSINFAGCAPYMVDVWKRGAGMDAALDALADPQTIVVMYFAAGMGYMIDWAVTGIVASVLIQRAKSRMKDIEAHQKLLVERWGPEVTGSIPLDEFGFAKESFASTPVENTQDHQNLKLP